MGIVEATVTNKGKKGLIRRFAPYFKKYLWILIFDLFCAALTTVCELALPIIVQQITNRGINDLASLTLSYILRIGGLYIFLKLVDVGDVLHGVYRPHHGHKDRDRHAPRHVRTPAEALVLVF